MNLKQLQKIELLNKTKSLVSEERRVTLELVEYLREIERRLLFSEMGFGSLFEFCVKYLGLSEGSAHRRISAMRLSRDVSGVKEKLESGVLSLSNAAKIQVAFAKVKKEKKLRLDEKAKIIEQCSNTTQSDCEKKLFSLLPEFAMIQKSEKQRRVSESEVELKVVLSAELQSKINKLKGFLSHSNPNGSTLDLIECLIDKELKNQEKKRGLLMQQLNSAEDFETNQSDKVSSNKITSTSIPALTKRRVWQKAKVKCEFPGCNSSYQLQVDHIQPKNLGGTNDLENLRLLCRAHNAQQAVQKLGPSIMQRYLPLLR